MPGCAAADSRKQHLHTVGSDVLHAVLCWMKCNRKRGTSNRDRKTNRANLPKPHIVNNVQNKEYDASLDPFPNSVDEWILAHLARCCSLCSGVMGSVEGWRSSLS